MHKSTPSGKNIIKEENAENSEKNAIVGGAPTENIIIMKQMRTILGDRELIPLFIKMFRVKQEK
jgi:hypothetical protein